MWLWGDFGSFFSKNGGCFVVVSFSHSFVVLLNVFFKWSVLDVVFLNFCFCFFLWSVLDVVCPYVCDLVLWINKELSLTSK